MRPGKCWKGPPCRSSEYLPKSKGRPRGRPLQLRDLAISSGSESSANKPRQTNKPGAKQKQSAWFRNDAYTQFARAQNAVR